MPNKDGHFLFLFLLLLSVGAFGQDRVISGIVRDENANPLPGVNIFLKGTTTGTATDADGQYKISYAITENSVLVFSFVGYTLMEVPVGSKTSVDLQMTPDAIALSEIVVVGYSTLRRKDISSSISVVDVNDMQKIAATNFADQLQGKVAGVQIATSGDPGSFQFVRIRGFGSINNNEPLYVIDGVPVQNETNMNFLNPNDIESMQVLKDAAASSIYGARAANGVIVITTKKGKGKSKLNIDFSTGIQTLPEFPQMPSPEEQLQLELGRAEGGGHTFNPKSFYIKDVSGSWILPDYYVANNGTIRGYQSGDPKVDPTKYKLNTDPVATSYNDNYLIVKTNKEGTNWFEELFKPATMTRLDLSASGASEDGNYYLSAGYYDYNGIMIENAYSRFQMRSNSSFNIRKKIRIGETLNMAYQKTKGPNANTPDGYEYSAYSAQIGELFGAATICPVYDINGYAAVDISGSPTNPVIMKVREADGIVDHLLRVTGSVFGEIDFLKYFTYRSNFGLDYNDGPFNVYVATAPEVAGANANNSLSNSWFNTRSWVWTNTINFTKTFGDHHFSGLAGAELRDTYSESFASGGQTLRFDFPSYRVLSNVENNYSIKGAQSESKMNSLFLNANYNYADKYLLSVTVRCDGSSRFVNHRYGTFPAASAAWRMSKESFLLGSEVISDLKVRGSYGVTGNNEVLGGDYPGYSTFVQAKTSSWYDVKGNGNRIVPGYYQNSTGNPDLKWESSIVTNLAIDATLFDHFDMTVEWYYRKTKDMIYGVTQPLEAGNIGPVNQNIGSMSNKGIDLQLNYRGKALTDKLSYAIGLTGTHYKNKVQALSADENEFVPTRYTRTQAGYPISQFYGYIADGLWQSQEQIDSELPNDTSSAVKPGRMRYVDVNHDGKINAGDRTFIGNPNPKFILGLNLTGSYGRFDFTAFLTGEYGKKIYNPFRQSIVARNSLAEAGITLPVLDETDRYSYQQSSFFVEDGSYTRLRNVTIGYSFSRTNAAKAGISKARIFLQAQNLFTITRYSALDPGVTVGDIKNGNVARRDLDVGVDYGRYPWSRQFYIGFNLEF